MWFEFSAGVTEEVERAEKENILVQFYNLKAGCYQGFHTCEGDVLVVINAMADYADLLMEFIKQSDFEEYTKAFYEIHVQRCRKISEKLQEQIGYDRNAAIEKCRAKRKHQEEDNDDVGEEALLIAVKRAKQKAKKEWGEVHLGGVYNRRCKKETGGRAEDFPGR